MPVRAELWEFLTGGEIGRGQARRVKHTGERRGMGASGDGPRVPASGERRSVPFARFRAPVIGTRQGKIVLVQLRNAIDPDNGERYTVKRYQSEKVMDGDSWRHARITLKPINRDFQSIELTGTEEGELQVVAELVEVLGGAL